MRHLAAQVKQLSAVHDRRQARRGEVRHLQPGVVPFDDAPFGLSRAVLHQQLEQKAVELRLGQRIGAFKFHWILRRDDQKHGRQRHALTLDGDLVLFHRLEQRRLRLGRCSIHLVGHDHIGKNGPAAERESRARRLEHAGAQDV